MKKENGQVVIILLLVMVIALAIGLSVVGRSVNEISTSTKTEESTRAFSAAEAGIEKALSQGYGNLPTDETLPSINLGASTFTNQASATVDTYKLPLDNTALEYPKIGKGEVAQFWLVDPTASPSAMATVVNKYTNSNFDIYFGRADVEAIDIYTTKPDEKPAIEVNVIYWDEGATPKAYNNYKTIIDSNSTRSSTSGNFASCTVTPSPIETNNYGAPANRSFYCKATITGYGYTGRSFPILVRVKPLFSTLSHPIALNPTSGSLPYQANIYRSKGTFGNVQRTIEVFQQAKVMPWFLDYALFSAGSLSK